MLRREVPGGGDRDGLDFLQKRGLWVGEKKLCGLESGGKCSRKECVQRPWGNTGRLGSSSSVRAGLAGKKGGVIFCPGKSAGPWVSLMPPHRQGGLT